MSGMKLWVTIEDSEPLIGNVGLLGSSESVRFEGWIGFMAAIDELRAGRAAVVRTEPP
jgi:hypothetical protein